MGALECWTEPAGKLESTCEEQAPEGSGEEQAPEGAGEEQAPEGAGEEQALGLGYNPSPRKPLTRPGVPGGARLAWNWTEPVEMKTGWAGPAATKMSWAEPVETLAGLCEPRAAADFPRTAGLREPRTAGLREPRTAADFPRTAGWASRGRRLRNPANGRPRSAAGGGGAPPSF